MYLVSAYFDDNANKILNGYIRKIADSSGNRFMTDNSVPPHMTISSIEAKNIDILIPNFLNLEKSLTAGRIQFVSVGQLLPYVLYTTPVLNRYLLDISDIIYNAFKDIPDSSISKYYKPLSWLPHVTLGKTLSQEEMFTAIKVIYDNFQPFDAEIVTLGLSKVNPHKDVALINLIQKK